MNHIISVKDKMETIVWSFGGGVQSVAIAVYIARGLLPKPNRVVMADTGRESSLTWDYTNLHSIPLLESLGLKLEIISHNYATVDLYAKNGDLLLPAYTKDGALPTFCSNEWKRRTVQRYLRTVEPVLYCSLWLGMSLDEVHRMRISDNKWIQNHYPLCFDYKRRRHECVTDILAFGLPEPPKSACWMCPHRTNAEWIQQRDLVPAEWIMACELDSMIRKIDALHSVYLHKSRLSLRQANLSSKDKPATMFDECADSCWT